MMLLPFAWMIVTSLKAPSEINEWPPTWSTKNFKKEWTLNLQVAPSSYDIRRGLSLEEFRTLAVEEKHNPYRLVYKLKVIMLEEASLKYCLELLIILRVLM